MHWRILNFVSDPRCETRVIPIIQILLKKVPDSMANYVIIISRIHSPECIVEEKYSGEIARERKKN